MEIILLKEPLKDVFLLSRARRPPLHKACGYLLGRKMNKTLFVEKIFPLPWKDLLNPETFFRLEKSHRLRILGVFSAGHPARKKKILHPLFCEKVFLSLKPDRKGEIRITACQVQFDRQFYFVPLERIILELEEEND
jgi:hypothetical protein